MSKEAVSHRKKPPIRKLIILACGFVFFTLAFIWIRLPEKTGKRDKWNYFSSTEGHFKILFPSYPQEAPQSCEEGVCMIYVSAASDGTRYIAGFEEYPNSIGLLNNL